MLVHLCRVGRGGGLLQKCTLLVVDSAISCLNKYLMFLVKDVLIFKDPAGKKV